MILKNSRSKMSDGSNSLFNNIWRHHNITSTVKVHNVLANFMISSIKFSLVVGNDEYIYIILRNFCGCNMSGC